jgi:alpha-L-fucosidase 2
MHEKIWYASAARDWLEGLPIGTGRLAAMILGTYKRERITLNHEWLWAGRNRDRDNRLAADRLAGVRELLLSGAYEDGTRAANEAFGNFPGGRPDASSGNRVDPYQPAGEIYVDVSHGPVSGYRRELDFSTGSVLVSYTAGRKQFRREYIAHLTKDLILFRYDAGGESFDARIQIDRLRDPGCSLAWGKAHGLLTMDGQIADGIGFRVELEYQHDADWVIEEPNGCVRLEGTRELIVALNAGTSANGGSPEDECEEKRMGLDSLPDWKELLSLHTTEHSKHYGSVSLSLPLDEPDAPTDERMRALREGTADPSLALTYFNYGRYLLCASSANATLPANLQGKWNEDLEPPWQSDYHHDINLQMNYWIAEPAGMQNYAEALLQHIERFVPHARKAAKDLYGCRGVWYPIQTDAWGRATAESFGWAVWIGAAAWLAQHMWWHWEFGRDRDFLRDRGYPFLKDVAEFYEDYLVEDEQGVLQVVPSQSPENRFTDSGTEFPVSICVSATMDIELIWDVLTHAIRGSEVLDIDADRRTLWASMLDRLPPLQIGSEGQLLEWNHEFEEQEPGHRHFSHLVGLYPGEQIHPDRTPEFYDAAVRSLERRLSHKGGHTGWSRAWTACLFARAGRGNDAMYHLEHLITDFATDTLLDLHPPRIFQIEGNFGGAAAVIEMLLQSYYEEIDLLPALPSGWPAGNVKGLRARGGYTVDISWQDGRLTEASVTSMETRTCRIHHKDQELMVSDAAGNRVKTERGSTCVEIPAEAGATYSVTLSN